MKCQFCGAPDASKPHCRPGTVAQCGARRLDLSRVPVMSDDEIKRLEADMAYLYVPDNAREVICRLLKTIRERR